jgi:hypothetical protein
MPSVSRIREPVRRPLQILIAEHYVQAKVRLDRIPALVQQRLERAEDQDRYFR